MKFRRLLIVISLFSLVDISKSEVKVFDLGRGNITSQKIISNDISSSANVKLSGIRQEDGSVLFEKTEDGEIIEPDYDDDNTEENNIKSTVPKFYNAVVNQNLIDVKRFLDSGTNPDTNLFNNNTALHMAASYGNTKMFNLLINHNASLSIMNSKKETPLHYACAYGNRYMLLSAIYKAGNDFLKIANMEGHNKRNCLHYASLNSKDPSVIKELLLRGLDASKVDGDGQTAGHYSVILAKWENLKMIAEHDVSSLKIKGNKDIEEKTAEDLIMTRMPLITKLQFFKFLNNDNQDKLNLLFGKTGI